MVPVGSLIAIVLMMAFVGFALWALFWFIRLAVRHGVSDALAASRDRRAEDSDATRL